MTPYLEYYRLSPSWRLVIAVQTSSFPYFFFFSKTYSPWLYMVIFRYPLMMPSTRRCKQEMAVVANSRDRQRQKSVSPRPMVAAWSVRALREGTCQPSIFGTSDSVAYGPPLQRRQPGSHHDYNDRRRLGEAIIGSFS